MADQTTAPTHVPLVSVVITAYNRADTIGRSIESVLAQDFTDFELIVVDDSSDDSTYLRICEYDDPRMRVIRNSKNHGISGGRNIGIENARGTWVAFQDSDDAWLPEKLSRQMKRLNREPGRFIACYCRMKVAGPDVQAGVPGGDARLIPPPGQEGLEGRIGPVLLKANPASTQTLVVRRDVLGQIGGFDRELPALVDWDLVLRLAVRGEIAFVEDPLVLQYFSLNSVTHSSAKRAEARLRILKKHHALWLSDPKALAQQYRSAAGEFRRLGKLDRALELVRKARQTRPAWLRIYAIEAALIAKRIFTHQE